MIYTTNSLEGFNRQLRKFTKIRTVFPTDDSLRKSLYLATELVMKKWTSPLSNWGVTLMKLEIIESTGYLQIDEARIVYRNFEGRPGLYNDEGDRSFSLVIKGDTPAETEEMANLLII